MAVTMVNQKHIIKFYRDGESDDSIYHINKDKSLADIRKIGDSKCSDWVLQLLDKTWLDDSKVLYQLAKIIQAECPQNEIDWENTFFIVEKKTHLDNVRELAEKENGKKSFETLMARIDLGIKESTPEVHEKIKKIVYQKLIDYSLRT